MLIPFYMEHLHAYWRMEYIKTPKDEGSPKSVFLRLPNTSDDRSAGIVQRRKHVYLVLNKYPYNAGHLLVVPYREVSSPEDLHDEESHDFWEAIRFAKTLLTKALNPDGFNIGINLGSAAGAGIPSHLHCHIVPRWNGDTNFMPVIGQTRVLPIALNSMWDQLTSAMNS